MPTITELGQKVKAKYPGQYDDLSDDDLGKKIKAKYPDDYKDFTDVAFKNPKTVRERATENLAAEGTDRAGAKAKAEGIQKAGEQEQAASDKAAKGEFASTMVKGAAVGAASLFTGGLALGPALTLMGGSALAGSIVGQAIEEGAGIHKSIKERAGTAAVDTALGAAGEGAGRTIGLIGKTLVPKMAAQAAAGTARGEKFFDALYKDLDQQLTNLVRGNAARQVGDVNMSPMVNVGPQLKKAYAAIEDLPLVKDAMKRFGGMTSKVGELMQSIEAKLTTVDGKIAANQPLDQMIQMKRSIQAFAHNEPDINRAARPIIKDLVTDLDKAIRDGLKDIGPEAEGLYQKTNDIITLLKKSSTLTDIAKTVIRKMTYRALGSAVGASVGGYEGGSKGATAGAIAGIAAPEISALVIQQIAAHPRAAALAKGAVQAFETGTKNAPSLMQRAIEMAGADETIKQTADGIKASQPPTMGQ